MVDEIEISDLDFSLVPPDTASRVATEICGLDEIRKELHDEDEMCMLYGAIQEIVDAAIKADRASDARSRPPMPEDVAGICILLKEAATYFERRPQQSEDRAYWANVFNVETCEKTAALIEAQAAEIERLRQTISDCADALGNGAFLDPRCSIEFCESLPSEIGLHVASLREDRDTWKEKCAESNAEIARLRSALDAINKEGEA